MSTLVSVSELKAQLSEQLRQVREGETLIVTDRGIPVARITPVDPMERQEAELRQLMEAGALRPGSGALDPAFWELPAPAAPSARVREALRQDREGGW